MSDENDDYDDDFEPDASTKSQSNKFTASQMTSNTYASDDFEAESDRLGSTMASSHATLVASQQDNVSMANGDADEDDGAAVAPAPAEEINGTAGEDSVDRKEDIQTTTKAASTMEGEAEHREEPSPTSSNRSKPVAGQAQQEEAAPAPVEKKETEKPQPGEFPVAPVTSQDDHQTKEEPTNTTADTPVVAHSEPAQEQKPDPAEKTQDEVAPEQPPGETENSNQGQDAAPPTDNIPSASQEGDKVANNAAQPESAAEPVATETQEAAPTENPDVKNESPSAEASDTKPPESTENAVAENSSAQPPPPPPEQNVKNGPAATGDSKSNSNSSEQKDEDTTASKSSENSNTDDHVSEPKKPITNSSKNKKAPQPPDSARTDDGHLSAPPSARKITSAPPGNSPAPMGPRATTPSTKKLKVSKRLYDPNPAPPRPPNTAPPGNGASPRHKKVHETSERLTAVPKRRALPPIDRGPKLEKDQQGKLVSRLYEQSMLQIRTKQDRNESLLQKQEPPKTVISQDTETFLVQRLYNDQQTKTKVMAQNLTNKYCQSAAQKTLSKEQVQANIKRMYYDRRDTKKAAHDKLFAKYVTDREPRFPKLSPGVMAASAQRLVSHNHNSRS
eukprot:TRINITY_DN60673_c0_g1_i1.p1 TRINITY_DN60673_c0_g1~~TRINITY_DN60673_c0_g1_i1.p1  ORF type:complete len:618 (-),score=95.08 TRINITY_DN60673_c0_g1_i1:67-1920(-)